MKTGNNRNPRYEPGNIAEIRGPREVGMDDVYATLPRDPAHAPDRFEALNPLHRHLDGRDAGGCEFAWQPFARRTDRHDDVPALNKRSRQKQDVLLSAGSDRARDDLENVHLSSFPRSLP